MPTYSTKDYDGIAHAIRKSRTEVYQHENEFERAATWYRINIPLAEREGPATSEARKRPTKKPKTRSEHREERRKKPKTFSALRKKAKQVEAAAAKLLLPTT